MLFITVTQLLHSGRERGQGCKDDGRSMPGAGVQSLEKELEGQRCLVVRRKKACEGDGKAAGQEETTKGGGEGLPRPSAESSESVETMMQNFFFRTIFTFSCKLL